MPYAILVRPPSAPTRAAVPLTGEPAAEGGRTDPYAEKIATITATQKQGRLTDAVGPGELPHAVIALTASWSTRRGPRGRC
ncbi:hypothetical protein [Streptomyces sp. NPDC023838]|uniref:hypothetical protein n=1 Tax=Streptomyces sp. NPDC023838 TaxID=3154325 RepID=UPI0033F6F4A8